MIELFPVKESPETGTVIKERRVVGEPTKNLHGLKRYVVHNIKDNYHLGAFRTLREANAFCKNSDRIALLLLMRDAGLVANFWLRGRRGVEFDRAVYALDEHLTFLRDGMAED